MAPLGSGSPGAREPRGGSRRSAWRRSAQRLSASGCVLCLAGAALIGTGCGSSSKPAYCSALTNLESSVRALTNVHVLQNGVGSVSAAVQKVQSDAQTLVVSTKTEFAPQTDAIKRSVAALEMSARQLSSSQTRPAALVGIPGQISALGTDVKSLAGAATKC